MITIYFKKGEIKVSKKWYEALDQEDVIFLHQLAQADFKSYLDLLVEQSILPQSIADVLYQKHLEGLE